jgi:Asp-tRNA(Asn)/Glu-tRNA(Gln) amidotransferase A subunit family amidase
MIMQQKTLTDLSAGALAALIASGEVTAVEAVEAHIEQIEMLGLQNYLSEQMK